ncbi:MAG: DHA2 family efflux MFS transporter permease subunit [Thermodesulfobacteriota bacterium]
MGPRSGPNKWLVAFAVMIPTFIEILDMTVVNVSLNHIQGDLSAGLDEVTWVLTSYLVSNAIVIPMSGWLASLIGRRRYLLLSIGLFTASSFACGSATSLGMLVVFRVFQGIGGGGLQPLSNAILLETFPQEEHGTAMAIFGMGIVLAPIVGPVLGGWITDNWTWRWIFYINVPIGALSLALTQLFIHDPPYLRKKGRRIDYWGIGFLVVGLGCLQIVLDKGERLDWFASPFIQRLSLISASALILFVVTELRKSEPVVDLSVFRQRSFAAGNLIMFLGFFAFFASIVLLPIYVQKLMGYNAWWAGWVLAPGGVASFMMMPLAARLMKKMDARKILFAGLAINAYSLHLMSRFSLSADFGSIVWPRFVQGIGLALFFVPVATLTVGRIPKEKMGNASAVFNLVRNLGGSFGVSVMTTQLARRAQFHHFRLTEHLTPYDPQFQEAIPRMMGWLDSQSGMGQASGPGPALGLLYGELNRQASMLAFNDAFFLDSLFFVVAFLLVLLIRKGKPNAGPVDMH